MRVSELKYLSTTVTDDNEISEAIKLKLQSGKKCLYALKELMTFKVLSIKKSKIYNTIIRPVAMYASETLTLAKENEQKLLRKIFGSVKDVETSQYTTKNLELAKLYSDLNIAVGWTRTATIRLMYNLTRLRRHHARTKTLRTNTHELKEHYQT